ncbi:7,8-didemethyl-8-hydroxy-5-deazariboflavin synthase CofG [Amnibacterium setariae]|uniref:7,8-didemethyl-8-hydroxy-5-deazariboflavin synthase n=1 Tax=Amnibacterium setariae TaxID=2306585 RepID=A0A3A1U5Y3_9MICO|nr:7,8-didemethyl-8-hydroxy-5-deazariboflavin synthase CofG [Amnibacterium setariae]RIX30867.1 7,8-didemethyl-8-hydroxy-5-deazariboflavin synthase subunit CofG [Amnibacterium setariae]
MPLTPTEPAVPAADVRAALTRAARGERAGRLDAATATSLLAARGPELEALLDLASAARDAGATARGGDTGRVITYSRKVFIPLTTLCRDRCHYCTFVDTPHGLLRKGEAAYLEPEQVLAIAREGAAAGCREALFTLGDRPEARWTAAADWLAAHGYGSTLEYLAAMARLVLDQTGLLPHLNPGVLTWIELQRLRPLAPSMGMMLETTSVPLWAQRGGAHFGSPDKDPALRLQVLEDAGRSRVPFTSGVLLGIGETLRDAADSLVAIRDAHDRWGHVQETIVQNFRAKARTAMQGAPDLATDRYVAAVATARLVLGPDAHLQAPPNLTDERELGLLIRAGIDDWGGVSPVTPDHVNPERPWPHVDDLARLTAEHGYRLRQRLTAHPRWLGDEWIDPALRAAVDAHADATGLAAEAGAPVRLAVPRAPASLDRLVGRAEDDPDGLADDDWAALLSADGDDLEALAAAADRARAATTGDVLTFVANRNLDGTRWDPEGRRGGLAADDVALLAAEAWAAGATEVCVQGPLHPALPGEAFPALVRALKAGAPGIHVHAFRPAEVLDGANRAGTSPEAFLRQLRAAGVGSVPGTAARVLDDRIRAALSGGTDPSVARWVAVVRAAHRAGLRSTATLVHGHLETPLQVVAHLRRLVAIQDDTGGFTELIAMPFVPADSPVGVPAGSRRGPSPREVRAVHAVARLLLRGRIDHVQAAWPKIGLDGARSVLAGGADDLGGLLLPGAAHPDAGAEAGRSIAVPDVDAVAAGLGRTVVQRTTTYGRADPERVAAVRAHRAPVLPVAGEAARRLLPVAS